MAGSVFWEGMLSEGQVDFIIDECKKSLEFGDYFHSPSGECTITSEDTEHLVMLTTLLNECVTLKENI